VLFGIVGRSSGGGLFLLLSAVVLFSVLGGFRSFFGAFGCFVVVSVLAVLFFFFRLFLGLFSGIFFWFSGIFSGCFSPSQNR
jgi:hypothetical protein